MIATVGTVRSLIHWIAMSALIVCLASCALLSRSPTATIDSVHLTVGNPSNAQPDVRMAENYLMVNDQFALSYNNRKRIPNWVSWQLSQQWMGTAPRSNNFRPDDRLPQGWYRVTPSDYNSSGYDRGHMTPSADRSNSPTDNSATFLMTNILPQTPDNNQGPWEKLESYCRELAKQGKELYIIAGSYGEKEVLARGKVTAPTHTWKVILVMDQPGQGVKSVTERTRVIAVDMPNKDGIKMTSWRTFRVTVDYLEQVTGYDFLSTLPESVQAEIESRVDSQ